MPVKVMQIFYFTTKGQNFCQEDFTHFGKGVSLRGWGRGGDLKLGFKIFYFKTYC